MEDTEIVLLDEWHAGTHGIPDAKTIEAIRLCARLEGMLTDPVYEGSRWPRSSISFGRDGSRQARRALRPPRRATRVERLRRRVLRQIGAEAGRRQQCRSND
jgi:hypothetical protein